MSWIIFSILAAFTWAVVNTIDKFILTKWIRNPVLPLIVLGFIGLLASIIIFFLHGFSFLSLPNILLGICSGLFYSLMSMFYFKAAKIEEISRVVPLFYLAPLFVLILASILINESFEKINYLGIFLLVVGALLISSRNLVRIRFGKAFWLMILSSLSLAINQVITKYLLGYSDFWTVFSWTRIGMFISLIPIYFTGIPDLQSTVRQHGKRVFGLISLSQCLNLLGVVFITIAISKGHVTLVNSLSSIQPLLVLIIVVLLSIFNPNILKEEFNKSNLTVKFIAILLIFCGAIIVS